MAMARSRKSHSRLQVLLGSHQHSTNEKQVITGLFFGTAIVAAAMRTAVRLHLQKRLFLDDAFLIIACAALTGAFAMLYQSLDTLFLIQHFAQEGAGARDEAASAGINVDAEVHKFQILDFVHEPLLWVVMFSVKAAFLVFFRLLVSRVEKMVVYWKAVCAITVVAFVFCLCYPFIASPHMDSSASELTCPNGRIETQAKFRWDKFSAIMARSSRNGTASLRLVLFSTWLPMS